MVISVFSMIFLLEINITDKIFYNILIQLFLNNIQITYSNLITKFFVYTR